MAALGSKGVVALSPVTVSILLLQVLQMSHVEAVDFFAYHQSNCTGPGTEYLKVEGALSGTCYPIPGAALALEIKNLGDGEDGFVYTQGGCSNLVGGPPGPMDSFCASYDEPAITGFGWDYR